tara:strand:- start:1576 stop:6378 length:4803 start_codon:yes stop_codon:yes gene_type:complete
MTSLLKEINEMQATGFSQGEIDNFSATKRAELKAQGYTDNEILSEFGVKKTPNTDQEEYWANVSKLSYSEQATRNLTDKIKSDNEWMPEIEYGVGGPRPTSETQLMIDDYVNNSSSDENEFELKRYFSRGLDGSTINLMKNYYTTGEVPDVYKNTDLTNPSTIERVTQSLGQILADAPIYVGAGGATTFATGSPIAGGFAAGFVNGSLRESYLEALERGDVNTFKEWSDVFVEEGFKGGLKEGAMIAAAVAAPGVGGFVMNKFAPVATAQLSKIYGAKAFGKYAASWAGFNTAMGVIEQRMPTKEELVDSAILFGILGFGSKGIENTYNYIKKNPEKSVLESTQEIINDPILKEDILSVNNVDRHTPIVRTQERLSILEQKEAKVGRNEMSFVEANELKSLRELNEKGEIPGEFDISLNIDTMDTISLKDLFNESLYSKSRVKDLLESPEFENHPEILRLKDSVARIETTLDKAKREGKFDETTNTFTEAWKLENNWAQIIKDLNSNVNASSNRKAVILYGGSATGKSTQANRINSGEQKYQIVDPDFVKEHPQFAKTYEDGKGANALHFESKAIANRILDQSTNKGTNVIVPLVGSGGTANVAAIAKMLYNKGYEVTVGGLETLANEAIYRTLKRTLDNGRYVPIEYVKSAAKQSRENYEYAKELKEVSETFRLDTTPKGEPILIERSGTGTTNVETRRDGGTGSAESSNSIGIPNVERKSVAESISYEPPKRERVPFEDLKNEFIRTVVDQFHPLLRAVRRVGPEEYKNGRLNPYEEIRTQPGMVGIAMQFITNATFEFGSQARVTGKSLLEVLKPLKNMADYARLSEYLVSKRVIELNQRGIKTGVDLVDAQRIVKERRAEYETISKELEGFQDRLLQYMADSGILSEKALAAMREANKDYVPFSRVQDINKKGSATGAGSLSKEVSNPIKKIKGSNLKIIDPIESIFGNVFHFITVAERNASVKSFIEMTEKFPEKFPEVNKVKTKMKAVKITTEEMNTVFENSKIDAKTAENLTVFRRENTVLSETEVVIFRNGEKEVWQVGREFATAIRGLDKVNLARYIRAFSIPSRLLRAGSTLSPDFFIRNLLRDTSQSGIFSKSGSILQAAPILSTFRGVFHMMSGKLSPKIDSMTNKFERSGAVQSMLVSMDRNYMDVKVHKELNILPVWNKVKGANPLELLRILSEATETTTRMAEFSSAYNKALKNGLTEKEALRRAGFEARDVTLDFSKRGAKMQSINAITAFFNANIQGWAKLAEGFRDQPGVTTARIATYIMLPSALMWWVNHDKETYKELPQWQKDMFWIVITGEGPEEVVYRVPKPFGPGILFGTGTERILDLMFSETPDDVSEFLTEFVADNATDLIPDPDIVKPFIEQAFNKNTFTNQPIVPYSMEGIFPEYQYTPYTSEVAKEIGNTIRAFMNTADPDGKAGTFSPVTSPARIDAILKGWSGTLGKYVLEAADAALIASGYSEDPIRPAKKLSDMPFIKAFVVRHPSSGSEFIEDFYKEYEEIQTALTTLNQVEPSEVGNVIDIIDQDIGFDYIALQAYADVLNSQRSLINIVIRDKVNYSPIEKRQILDDTYYQMITIAKEGLKLFNK